MRARMVTSSSGSVRPSLVHQRLIRSTDTAFNIGAYFIIDGVWIARLLHIGPDEPLLCTRNPMPAVGVLQLAPQQVGIPHHVPVPLDDGDVCLRLLSDLRNQPFDPTLTNMQWVLHHGVAPPAKPAPPQHPRVLHAVGTPGAPMASYGSVYTASLGPYARHEGRCRAAPGTGRARAAGETGLVCSAVPGPPRVTTPGRQTRPAAPHATVATTSRHWRSARSGASSVPNPRPSPGGRTAVGCPVGL